MTRLRRFLAWLGLRAPYIFIVAFMTVLLGLQANQTAALRHESRLRDLKVCEGGNDYRRDDLAKWEYVIGLVRPSPGVEAFHKFIRDSDAERDCESFIKESP